jgi:hypothetical protein
MDELTTKKLLAYNKVMAYYKNYQAEKRANYTPEQKQAISQYVRTRYIRIKKENEVLDSDGNVVPKPKQIRKKRKPVIVEVEVDIIEIL